MTNSYRYTQTNLLDGEPYHYFYAPFEGVDLLRGYRESRELALDKLNEQLLAAGENKLASIISSWPEGKGTAEMEMPFGNVFDRHVDTAKELASATIWVAQGGDIKSPNLVDFVNSLIKKFEVSKRLRSRYVPGLKLEVKDSATVEAYCHLAFLTSLFPFASEKLWRMNALLKLNDVLISTDRSNVDVLALAAMIAAIRVELTMMERLAMEKGISLA